ncbi:ZBED1 [Branchiostoma lanceolatum]|uniref:ZBED1 protein n=1 Tax=Branchiostoma lanceolatum TaxID=7740 RepID=A0A8J9ZTB0_BRALA|nr:ZBED1 [Branchiostoma lanceolatum]
MSKFRKTASKVWDHATKQTLGYTKCKHCDEVIKSCGGTSNIARHLRRHHGIETTPHPATATLTAMFGEQNNNDPAQVQGTQPPTPPQLNTATDGPQMPAMPALPAQPSLPSTSSSTPTVSSASGSSTVNPFTLAARIANAKMPPAKQHTITGRICHYIVKSLRPYTIVEDPYFRACLHELNPFYKIPGRTEVSDRHIPKMYEVALDSLKDERKGVDYAALTGDGWTSRVADHYLTITIHYMKEWDLKVKILQTLTAEVSQTGDNIAAEIGQCLDDFGIKGKVEVMTTDNAKAMTNATTLAGIRLSLNCFAHTLNLSTQKVMNVPTVVSMLAIIRPVVVYFRNSYLAKVVLKEKKKALGKPNHVLILDVKTRWNSSYMMVDRFVEQFPAVMAASLDDRLKKKERWNGSLQSMMEKLERHLTEKEDDDKFSKDCKAAIMKDLLTRYQEDDRRQFLEEATALDPRFKSSAVVNEDVWDMITNTIEVEVGQTQALQVKEESKDTTERPEPVAVPPHDGLEDTCPAKKPKLSAMAEIFEDDDEVVVTDVQPPVPLRLRVQTEILKYKSLAKLKSTDDVISFWQAKVYELPLLSQHARKYLVVPGTSVPSERVFSTAGDIVSAERAALDPDSVNMLLFLNKNT